MTNLNDSPATAFRLFENFQSNWPHVQDAGTNRRKLLTRDEARRIAAGRERAGNYFLTMRPL
jgi:hypothetical protein